MTAAEVVKQLEPLGSESTRKVLRNHGVAEPLFGVKIGDLQRIQKRVKTDHALALELYDTGIYDAMYLAGMIADPQRMTKDDLRRRLVERQNSDAYQWALLISTHEQRHILQIREIKRDAKFPKQ